MYGGTRVSEISMIYNGVERFTELAPLNFMRLGRMTYDGGNIAFLQTEGYYWGAGVQSEDNAIGFSYMVGIMHPQYSRFKGFGFSIRCLVR